MPTSNCETRTALLDAAEELFSERGYDAVGIRDIASRAATNLASIKYHFGSKNELYLETVSRAMTRPEGDSAWDVLDGPSVPESQIAAAALLARFIHEFIPQVLSDGSDACGRLIIREGIQPSQAVDAVVDHYIRPNQLRLVRVLKVLRPDDPPRDLDLAAQSILGQMVHYRVFLPIMERLHGGNLRTFAAHEDLAEHITRFSLRGLGFDEPFITRVAAVRRDAAVLH